MNKCLVMILSAVLFFFALSDIKTASAMDKKGCLTCHRYPGLVKFEKPDTFKVLHIDEEKQLESSHKDTDCKECHPETVQIPHTNVIEVECTIKCHSQDKDRIDNIERSYLTDFHKNERFAITRLDDETSCRVCHPLYPHSEHNKVRALLNMHIGFMLCEVCHIKKEHLEDFTYDWNVPEEFEYTGEPYGTHQKKKVPGKKTSKSVISRMLHILADEDSPENVEVKHFISRIAVYKLEGGKKSLFINTQDNEKAANYLENEKNMGSTEKDKEMKFFHRDIAKKEISVACDDCHSIKGILDFRKLGFNDNRTKDLQYLNIKGLVTKYDTFYIPNLFGPKE